MGNETCLLCGTYLNREVQWGQVFCWQPLAWSDVCAACQAAFVSFQSREGQCQGCGRPIDALAVTPYHQAHSFEGGTYCLDCLYWLHRVPSAWVNHQPILDYNDFFREWLYRYKYQGDPYLAGVVTPYLQKAYAAYSSYTWVPIPSSPQTLAERGFYAGKYLLEQAGIPSVDLLCYQGAGYQRQAQKSRQDRLKLTGVFQVDPQIFHSQTAYLFFDDVYTTGATIMTAKQTLMTYAATIGVGPVTVLSLSLGRDLLSDE